MSFDGSRGKKCRKDTIRYVKEDYVYFVSLLLTVLNGIVWNNLTRLSSICMPKLF